MNPTLKEILFALVETNICQIWPTARIVSGSLPKGWKMWELEPTAAVTQFLVLVVTSKSDSFTVELAWNKERELPLLYHDPDEGQMTNARFRLSRLWQLDGDEKWWTVENEFPLPSLLKPQPSLDEKLKRLPIQVEACFEKLREFGVPYLANVQMNSTHTP